MKVGLSSPAAPFARYVNNSVARSQIGTLVIFILAVASLLAFSGWTWSYTMDDAFISFRYSQHIGDGAGPIWNLADRANPVEGFTSFLHVWTLGVINLLTNADVVLAGKILGVVAGLALVGVVSTEVRRFSLNGLAALVAFSIFFLPLIAMNSVSGMETAFFMLWGFLTAALCLRALDRPSSRSAWLFVVFGLLGTLTRPEFVLPFLLMAAYLWWRQKEIRSTLVKAILVAYVLPGLALTLWRYSFYGDIVPNPFYVKQDGSINRWGILYVGRFVGFMAMPYLILIASRWRTLWCDHRNLLVVVGLNLGTACIYFSTTIPLMGWWYRFLIPQLPLLALLAGVALQTAKNLDQRPASVASTLASLLVALTALAAVGFLLASPIRTGHWFDPLLPVVPLTLLLGVVTLGTGEKLLHFSPKIAQAVGIGLIVVFSLAHLPLTAWFLPGHHATEVRFKELGQRLRPFAADDRWLVYKDVGSIVYESEWNTVDVVGLNTRSDDLESYCAMKTDLVLLFSWNEGEISNPCSTAPGLYLKLVDLPFGTGHAISRDDRYRSSYMRVYLRNDVTYADELKASLLDNWPERYSRPTSWMEGYWEKYRWIFAAI